MYKYLLLVLFSLYASFSTFANDLTNRISIGNPGASLDKGILYSIDAMRVFNENHAFVLRTNQASTSSQADYLVGYRYYFSQKAITDSWFIETGYKWGRDVTYGSIYNPFPWSEEEYIEVEEVEYLHLTYGYQFVFFDKMTFEYSVGYDFDIKTNDSGSVSGTLSVGILF